MEKDKKEKLPRTASKATAEARGREDAPAPKRRKGARTTSEESEDEVSEGDRAGEVEQNSKAIRWLVRQMGVLEKTVLDRLPEKKGMPCVEAGVGGDIVG